MSAPSILNPRPGFVTVFRSGNWFEAYMAANALEGHEIESIIVNDDICRFRPDAAWIVGGAKVLVNRADEEAASDVIGLIHPHDLPVPVNPLRHRFLQK
jgi:hypothetical protein